MPGNLWQGSDLVEDTASCCVCVRLSLAEDHPMSVSMYGGHFLTPFKLTPLFLYSQVLYHSPLIRMGPVKPRNTASCTLSYKN
jgi:hypothetical protein